MSGKRARLMRQSADPQSLRRFSEREMVTLAADQFTHGVTQSFALVRALFVDSTADQLAKSTDADAAANAKQEAELARLLTALADMERGLIDGFPLAVAALRDGREPPQVTIRPLGPRQEGV